MTKLSPSILAADPLNLGNAARLIKEAGCDEVHFDVMDGCFVPNLTFGPHILKAMKQQVPMVYDVHLMLKNPLGMIPAFAEAGADIITVHAEAEDADESLALIRKLGLKVGLSVCPGTPVTALRPYLDNLDRVLLMTVVPGFGGQKLMPEVLPKARELRALGFKGEIEADGGITAENMYTLAEAGIGVLVMGTGFFKAASPAGIAEKVHAL